MVSIAICFPKKADVAFITKEVEQGFSRRNVAVSILPYQSVEELMVNTYQGSIPDILIYHINAEHGKLKKAALYLKKRNRNLISIVIGNTSRLHVDEYTALQPVYEIASYTRKKFWDSIYKAYDFSLKKPDIFLYYRRPEYISMPLNQIIYFTSEGRQIHIVSTDAESLFYQKLDTIEEILQFKKCDFIRIHKSFLVNVDYIASFSRTHLTLISGECLPISNYMYYKQLKSLLQMERKTS